MFGAMAALAVPNVSSGAGSTEPLYIKHILKYSGGISNGVREMVSVDAQTVAREEW